MYSFLKFYCDNCQEKTLLPKVVLCLNMWKINGSGSDSRSWNQRQPTKSCSTEFPSCFTQVGLLICWPWRLQGPPKNSKLLKLTSHALNGAGLSTCLADICLLQASYLSWTTNSAVMRNILSLNGFHFQRHMLCSFFVKVFLEE